MSHMGLYRPDQNQAKGTRKQSGYTRPLLAFIMPHYYLQSLAIIHTVLILVIHLCWMSGCYGCLHGTEGLQKSLSEREGMFVRSKKP